MVPLPRAAREEMEDLSKLLWRELGSCIIVVPHWYFMSALWALGGVLNRGSAHIAFGEKDIQ